MTVTRIYRFSASHRLHSAELSEAENARLYGKCNNPYGHGHDYVLEVAVTGVPDKRTGLVVPIPALDRLVEETILELFASRNMNRDVPQFERLVPTTENVLLVIAELLEQHWSSYLRGTLAQLHRVHLQETDRNGFELQLGTRERRPSSIFERESLSIHA